MSASLHRRQFLKFSSAAAITSAFSISRSHGLDSAAELYRRVIPANKNLNPDWTRSLISRGHELDRGIECNSKSELAGIGMTVGGIGCGTVYLSGDGRLYVWDVFHRPHEGVVANRTDKFPKGMENIKGAGKLMRERDGSNYVYPPTADSHPNPFDQGFTLQLDDGSNARPLDSKGWSDVHFTGRWPLGTVDYSDEASPVNVKLESWTPFIPLSTDDSALPATVMEYTISNTSSKAVSGHLTGQWSNPVLIHTRKKHAVDVESVSRDVTSSPANRHGILLHTAANPAGAANPHAGAGDCGSAALAVMEGFDRSSQDSLTRAFELKPGKTTTIRFILAWHFPNMPEMKGVGKRQPYYTTRFKDAAAVVEHVCREFERLRNSTMAWVQTWNDSTLPQWLLDRSILTTNTLQTTTCHLFENRRFWAWEGIGCCPGTCAHVWHYAQGIARLFPDLERNLREVTDFAIALNPDGAIRFRAENNKGPAIDAQTGIILRTWREHLVSKNSDFLERIWPQTQKALEWLLKFDENGRGGLDGLLDGEQHNTLDAEWYGKVHCLCSLYLASLRAGESMANEMGDAAFAARCHKLHETGSEKIAMLFNSEFYIQEEDPKHATAIGVGQGCYIDQVIGQWWATQTGLGRIYDKTHIQSALHSLWKYNFVPEIGSFRKSFPRGRFYALPQDAGLVMCTWPNGGLKEDFMKHWQYGYFNECMTGFEWQAAAHMIQEGATIRDKDIAGSNSIMDDNSDPRSLTLRGLAISRAIHDRYAPSLRNPYNEIECSDHYARANASYSVFLAVCGFEYDGPKGIIGFAPKLNPEKFKAAFTAAEGWGSYEQAVDSNGKHVAQITLTHGHLLLSEIRLPWITKGCQIHLGDQPVAATLEDGRAIFESKQTLTTSMSGLRLVSA